MKKKNAIQEAEEYGIDLSLLWDSLRKTPTERLLSHQQALNLFFVVKQAGADARQRRTLKTTSNKQN